MISRYRQKEVDALFSEIIKLTEKRVLVWKKDGSESWAAEVVSQSPYTCYKLIVSEKHKTFTLYREDSRASNYFDCGKLSYATSDRLFSLLTNKADKFNLDLISDFIFVAKNGRKIDE